MKTLLLTLGATALMSAPAMAQDEHAGHHPDAPAASAAVAPPPLAPVQRMQGMPAGGNAQSSSDCNCPCAEMMRRMMQEHGAQQPPGTDKEHAH